MAAIDILAQRINQKVQTTENNKGWWQKTKDFFTDEDLDKTKYLGDINKEKEAVWQNHIMPKLKSAKADQATISQAYRNWTNQVQSWSENNGFMLKQGQSINQQRSDNLVQKIAKADTSGTLSDKLTARAKVGKVGIGAGVKSMQGGGVRAVHSIAQYVADYGNTDRNSSRQKVANYLKQAENEIKASNIAYQDIQQNGSTVQKIGLMAGEQVAPILGTGGIGGGIAKGAIALGAGTKTAAAIGMATTTGVNYTQNYGDVREGVIDELGQASASQLANSKDEKTRKLFSDHLANYTKKGMNQADAIEQARLDTINDVAESYAEDYGKIVTALEPISAGAGKLGTKLALGVMPDIVGKSVTKSEQKAISQAIAGQTSKVAGATAMAKSGSVTIGKSALEEGLQEGLTDWASQKSAVDTGIKESNDWNQTAESAGYGALLGGLMGGGANIATGETRHQQAKQTLNDIQQTQATTNTQLNELQQQHTALSQVANPTAEQTQQLQAIEKNIRDLETVKTDNEAKAQSLNIPEPVLNRHVDNPYVSTLKEHTSQDSQATNQAESTSQTSPTNQSTNTTSPTATPDTGSTATDSSGSTTVGFDVSQHLNLDHDSLEQAWLNHQQEMADNATITDGSHEMTTADAVAHANQVISDDNKLVENQGGIAGVVARNEQRQSQTVLDNEMDDWHAQKQQLQAERDARLQQEMNTPDESSIRLMDVNDGENFDTTVTGLNGEPFRLANAWDSLLPAKAKQQAIATVFGGKLPQKLASATWGELNPQIQKKLHTWFAQEMDNRRAEKQQANIPQLNMRDVTPQPVNELPSGNEPINLGYADNQTVLNEPFAIAPTADSLLTTPQESNGVMGNSQPVTNQTQTNEPIPSKDVALGKDGKPKWFGNERKALDFIANNNLLATHQVVQTAKSRYEILPKSAQLTAQDDINTAIDPQQANAEQNEQSSTQSDTQDNIENYPASDIDKVIELATIFGDYNQKDKNIILKSSGEPFPTADMLQRAIKNRKLNIADYHLISDGSRFVGVKDDSKAHQMLQTGENIVAPDYDSKVMAKEKQSSDQRLQTTDVVRNYKNKPFKQKATAEKFQADNNLDTTHEIKAVDGGFELHRLPIAKQADINNKANGVQDYGDIQSQVAQEMGIGVNSDGEYDVTDEQFAEMNKRINAIQREQRGLSSAKEPTAKQPPSDSKKAILDEMQKSGHLEIVGLGTPSKPTTDGDKFAGNTIFTSDKVAQARARMKSKLTQLNSGLDPELMMDGMTIAGAYIESGVRKFGDYASAMIEDFGDNIKPYLLSFWESARHFPNLDINGMTSVEDSKKQFDELNRVTYDNQNNAQEQTDDGQQSTSGLGRRREPTTAPIPSEHGEETLGGVSANDVQTVPTAGHTTAENRRSGGTDVAGDGTAGRNGLQGLRSKGDSLSDVHSTATRTGSDGRVGEGRLAEPVPTQAVVADNVATDYPISNVPSENHDSDFTIEESDQIGQGGLKTKFKQNLEAIKLLKQLQAENRQATRDEQKILTKWVGWGGLQTAFRRGDGSVAKGWQSEVEQLEAILTPEELQSASDSTIAAHYTDPKIVKAMWTAVQKMGFTGGRVLEPAVGSGIFLGLMPSSLRKGTAIYGTELDTITGGLAQQLYPKANIKVMGFQDYNLNNGFFKVAIGNPPFGNLKITDFDRRHLSGLSLHNYFFAKSLDALEDNGVLAMVVTNRLLDGADPKTREYLFENAELLGAIRLPNNAFKENANTEVTTDIIFLRKRTEMERINGLTNGFDFREVQNYTDKNGDVVPLNSYFVKNPAMMLGEFGNFGSMYSRGGNGVETALVAPKGQDTIALLNQALEKLPTGIITPHNKDDALIIESMVKNIPDVKIGSLFEQDGTIYERTPDAMGERQAIIKDQANQKAIDRIKGMIGLRDVLAEVRQMQLTSGIDEAMLDNKRTELNQTYDDFVKNFGYINSDSNKRLFRDDPAWSQLSALEENYDKGVSEAVSKRTGEPAKKPSAKKAAILERRTQFPYVAVTQVSSAKDGMVETLNTLGRLDIGRISQLYGKDEQTVIDELGDLIYQDPVSGWVTADNYLSGNVKAKLAQAKEAMAQYGSQYERNVKALEAVIPADIEAVDIEVRAGSHWIPPKYIENFLTEVMGATRLEGSANYNRFSTEWNLPKFSESAEATTQFGTSRKSVYEIVTAAMNGKQVTVYDQIDRDTRRVNEEATNDANQKVEAVKRAWNDWIWLDDNRRDTLARLYNDIFNTDVTQTYDGSHLKLVGKVDDNVIDLRPTQKNAVWRITQNPTTLLDHVVGAGKTFTMVASAMELRRMGLASKPMIVVPNHLVGQWGKEFIQLYPNANILVATKKDFEAVNRKRLVARIANGDWDAVIVAHTSFGKIAVDPAFEAEFIKDQIAEVSHAIEQAKAEQGKNSSVKDMAKRRLQLEEKYKKLVANNNRDTDNLHWGELGVDALFVDEAHEFKNLAFVSSMQRVAGLGNQSGSQKAMDLFMKIQQLKQNTSSRIVFATGTPISNSMAEMYTMQRYLDMERMQNQGVYGFDAWAKTFGEVVNDWELSASGKYQMKSRFAKFVNMPELMQSYLGFADVINRDDINDALKAQGKKLPVPKIKGGSPQNTVVARSPEQANFIGVPTVDEHGNEKYPKHSIIYRADNLPKGQAAKIKGADNMLKIMGEARKAALDMRIINPNAPDFAGSKVNKAVENIVRIYQDTTADKGTQLVFCDLSTPKGSNAKEQAKLNELVRLADEGDETAISQLDKYSPDEIDAIMNANSFSVYDDIKAKLIKNGITENEIAFIHDANTELQKDELFSKVRSGRVRVLLGSTSKMGAGTNVQTRLVALHHMDAPWRPSDLEQREGRIIRQGNELYAKDPENFEVEIHRYATEQTMDAMQWQIIENKAKFIEQVRKGDIKTRVIEDIEGEAANAGAMKAAASGNPLILEEMALKKQLNDLESDKTRHDREQHRIKATIKRTQDDSQFFEREQQRYTTLSQAKTPSEFAMSIDGKTYQQGQEGARVNAGTAIISQAVKASMSKDKLTIGKYGDFTITATTNPINRDSAIIALEYEGENMALEVKHNDPVGGIITKLQNLVKAIPSKLQEVKDGLQKSLNAVPKLQSQLKPWGKDSELNQLRQKHSDVMDALKPKKQGEPSQSIQHSIQSIKGKTTTPTQVRETLVKQHGEKVITTLEQAGVLHIKQLSDFVGSDGKLTIADDAEGFFHDGKAVLIADNIDPDQIMPVFLHEVGGHAGLQAMLSPQAYANLMQTFNAMVARGDDVALRAKLRAEQATDSESQATTEYLPYLLSEISTMQQRTPFIKRLLDRFVGAVRAWVFAKTGVRMNLTHADILGLAELTIKQQAKDIENQAKLIKQLRQLPMTTRMGQRQGLFDLPDVPVVTIEAKDLSDKDTKQLADTLLRELQKAPLGTLHNNDTNWDFVIGKKDRLKMGDNNNLSHATSQAVQGLTDLVANAVLAETHQDMEHNNPDVKAVHRLYVPADINGDLYRVKLTVKDYAFTTGMPPKKSLHAIEAVEIENAPMGTLPPYSTSNDVQTVQPTSERLALLGTLPSNQDDQIVQPTTGRTISIADLLKGATRHDGKAFEKDSPNYSRRFAPVSQSPIPAKPTAKKASDWLNTQWAVKWVSWDGFKRLIRRNIATPQHVALNHADYKTFWNRVQSRINYTNYEASNAVNLVPEILDKRLIVGQNKKDIEAVSRVIFDGTMADVVYTDSQLQSKGLNDKQIDLYRRVRQAIDESVEKMSMDILANSAKGTGLVSLDEILRIKEAITATGGGLGMFNSAMQQAVRTKVQALEQAGIITAKKATTLNTMFDEVAKQMDDVENRVYDLQDKGYAPLMRFGSYAVAVENAKGDLVLYELYESKKAQQKALYDLKRNPDYQGMKFNENVLNPADYQQFTNKGLNPETVMLFANELGLNSDEANQAYLKVAIAQQSALKRLIHRKKVAGFSEDLPRVLSAFVMSNARHSSRMLYNGDIEKSIQGIKDGDLRGEAQNLFENMENPAEEFATFRSMMFHWNMGFSPAFGLLNMTQPFIQTIPQLTMYGGSIKAHKAMLSGLRKAMASQVAEDGKGLGVNPNAKEFVYRIPAYMRDDYIRMTKEGHLDPQNVWLLQGLERGKAGVTSGTLGMVEQAAGYFSEATETINRRATMYAALEVAHSMGQAGLKAKGFDSAYDFAVTTIQQTQGVYNKGNRSGLARSTGVASKFGAVIMMYKQFSINLVEQQIRMGQQKQAKALATAWVYQWLLAGAMGLIGADDLKDIIETIAFKLGYALNTERKAQEFFIEQFDKEQGNEFYQMFMYGIPSAVLPIDFHGRASAGNILPATGLLHPANAKAEDQKAEAMEALGVGVNWMSNMFDASKLMMGGHYRDAMVTAAPRYVRDTIQAVEIATTGSMRDKQGRKVMDMTTADAVAKAMQFNPTSNAKRGRDATLNYQDKKVIENVKNEFSINLAEAIATNNQTAQDKVYADIDKWNAKNATQYQMDKNKITESAKKRAENRDFSSEERQTLPKSLKAYVESLNAS